MLNIAPTSHCFNLYKLSYLTFDREVLLSNVDLKYVFFSEKIYMFHFDKFHENSFTILIILVGITLNL